MRYFEGLDSQPGTAWSYANSVALRTFMGIAPSMAIIQKGLQWGEAVAIDATLEANAAMRSIVRKDNGQDWKRYSQDLARAEGIEIPAEEDLRRLDQLKKTQHARNMSAKPHDAATALAILFGLMFFCFAQASAETYSTTFQTDQSPLSENGLWTDGYTTGKLWTDCIATNNGAGLHYACGTQPGTGVYNDSIAVLSGTNWGPTQKLQITLYITNPATESPTYPEIEYGLQCSLTASNFTGYFMDVGVGSDKSYIELGLAYNAQQYPAGWTDWRSSQDNENMAPIPNGTVITAAITNNIISIYTNGVLVLTDTNNSGYYPTDQNGTIYGAPAIGFFRSTTGMPNANFGISSFYATDGATTSAPSVSLSATPTNFIASITNQLSAVSNPPTATLTWSSTDATNVTLSGFGAVPLNGTTNVSPAQTTNYTITATGSGGTNSASVTVIVPAPPTNVKASSP